MERDARRDGRTDGVASGLMVAAERAAGLTLVEEGRNSESEG